MPQLISSAELFLKELETVLPVIQAINFLMVNACWEATSTLIPIPFVVNGLTKSAFRALQEAILIVKAFVWEWTPIAPLLTIKVELA